MSHLHWHGGTHSQNKSEISSSGIIIVDTFRPAQGVPLLPARNQGKSRTAFPLCSRGLFPGPQLPQPRGSQRPVHPVAGRDRQPPPARHHPARRRGAFRRGAAPPQAVAGRPLQQRARPGAPRHPRRHGVGRRTSIPCRAAPGGAPWRCNSRRRPSPSWRTALPSLLIPRWKDAASGASPPATEPSPRRPTARLPGMSPLKPPSPKATR
jgi:hypothetical protein